jgi:hypothetical protein
VRNAAIKPKKLNWEPVAHACNPSYSGAEIRRLEVQSQPGHIVQQNDEKDNTHW